MDRTDEEEEEQEGEGEEGEPRDGEGEDEQTDELRDEGRGEGADGGRETGRACLRVSKADMIFFTLPNMPAGLGTLSESLREQEGSLANRKWLMISPASSL